MTRLTGTGNDTRQCWTRHKNGPRRKRRILSVGEYLELATDPDMHPYRCEICGAVHQGHPITATAS